MNLAQFNKKYSLDNGYIGPYQHKDGRIMVSKQKKEAGSNGGYWRHEYFTIYKCKYCGENALSTDRSYNSKDGTRNTPATCSRYSECFSIHAGIQIAKDHIIHTRQNPGIDSHGYYCWREPKLDKNGEKISTGDGNKRIYVYEHRVVMEEHLGRKLKSWESVHHIDMDKLNNDISNLWLCTAKTHHMAHSSYNEICGKLMTNFNKYSGIGFDKQKGKYYLKDSVNSLNKEIA